MKSFGIKRDEKDPRWAKFIAWANNIHDLCWNGLSNSFYGIDKDGDWDCIGISSCFDRIITLDEWESEFMHPKLAGREYDAELLREWGNFVLHNTFPLHGDFLDQRYEKADRISELKQQIEKLTKELKDLEI